MQESDLEDLILKKQNLSFTRAGKKFKARLLIKRQETTFEFDKNNNYSQQKYSKQNHYKDLSGVQE